MKETNLLYDFILRNDIATEDEIDLVTNINGYGGTSLMDIIEVRTGYKSMEQLYLDGCYYFSDEDIEFFGLAEDDDDE